MSSNGGGQRLVANRYVLRRELGRGGMGIVWLAHDPELHRDVAVKQVLLPGHFTPAERHEAHARVRREARSAARVSHPTVITIHDVFEWEGSPWVVMELVEGGSLQEMLEREGHLDPDRVARIADSLLRAVHHAEEAGVLHRDIKPGNIMMSTDGRVILTDFGIATIEGGPSITRTGALVGSPEYMAPERLEGGEAEHRNDLWSIGVTLYTALEGQSPFRRDTITAAIAAVVSGPVPPMQRAGWLEPVVSGLLERDPDRRMTVDQALHLLSTGGADTSAHQGAGGAQAAHFADSGAHEPHHGYEPHHAHDPYYAHEAHHAHEAAPPPGGYYDHYDPYEQQGYHDHGAPGGRRPGMSLGILLALGAGVLAVILVAGTVLYLVGTSGGGDAERADTSAEERPGSEQAAEGSGDRTDSDDGGGGEGDPPGYDELETFVADPFAVGHPQGWRVDDSEIGDDSLTFYPDGHDQQVWVAGWPEPIDAGSSYDYLVETEGGTVDDPSTTGFEPLEVEEEDGDFSEAWDVAFMEAELVNDTWPSPERHYWIYAVAIEHQGEQMMYNVSVNVPRDQADFYDDLHEDVIETFNPNL